ncbi:MAG: DedA family protein [Candidatus Omnitrophota bacterium]|nr:DedA family protein [Candidatus Omnitrophota bacterium]
MELLRQSIDFLLHLDVHINVIIQQFGLWTYLLVFGIIFAETGLVVTPFLPGDSLLFVLGAFAAQGALHPLLLAGILILAAVAGDSVNYAFGKYLGARMLQAKRIHLFKKEHLDKAHNFYKKYGAKTIILARFIPVIRTFAPFVAGIARMDYGKFFLYNVAGGILWVVLLVFSGYFFGNIAFVKENFSLVVMLIIIVSILPAVFEFLKASLSAKKSPESITPES